MGRSVQANWYVDSLTLPSDSDPLGQIQTLVKSAERIDLSRTAEDMQDEFNRLMEREAILADRVRDDDGTEGVECSLKWSPAHHLVNEAGRLNCHNCPHYVSDENSVRHTLCQIGRRQGEIVEEMRGAEMALSLEQELVAAFERDIEGSAELAEALLA